MPWPDYFTVGDNIRFFQQQNVTGVYQEGQCECNGHVPLTQSDYLIPRVEQTRHTAAICKSSRAGLARSSVSAATVGKTVARL